MDWTQWEPTYRAILVDFGWHEQDDAAAAAALHDALGGRSAWRDVGTEIKRRHVTVVGCGPALDQLRPHDLHGVVVAADGAVSRLRAIGVLPRVVVTDLDGNPDDLKWAADQGASMVVHAHGDNQAKLGLVADLGSFVAGTYQSTPDPELSPLRNLGGFTDGDRAVMLCQAYQVRSLHVAAFDATAAPSGHSHDFDPAIKARKLAWMGRILDDAATRLPMTGSWRG
ncbi:MAG: 6-hydroxymethylpterin diphosphokinase MptE-like protein [Thermoplasmatota archaeon]